MTAAQSWRVPEHARRPDRGKSTASRPRKATVAATRSSSDKEGKPLKTTGGAVHRGLVGPRGRARPVDTRRGRKPATVPTRSPSTAGSARTPASPSVTARRCCWPTAPSRGSPSSGSSPSGRRTTCSVPASPRSNGDSPGRCSATAAQSDTDRRGGRARGRPADLAAASTRSCRQGTRR